MNQNARNQRWARGARAAMLILSIAMFGWSIPAASQAQKKIKPRTFPTPEAAVSALVDAARRNSDEDLIKIVGSYGRGPRELGRRRPGRQEARGLDQ